MPPVRYNAVLTAATGGIREWRKSGSAWPAAASFRAAHVCLPARLRRGCRSQRRSRPGATTSSILPRRHRIPTAYRSFRDLIADGEIDVVDICTPPNLHAAMIVDAMQAGKHVICEKPFAGYFGRDGDKAPIGKHVPKALMYERVLEEMEGTRAAIEQDRQALHVCGRLDLRAGGDQDRGDPESHQRQDPVHEGRGEPQRLARRARGAMGDDRRRLADPDGLPSAFGGALSQAGRGESARRGDRRRERDLRRRQRHGVPAAGGAHLHQGQSGRCRGLGHADRRHSPTAPRRRCFPAT